MELNLPVNAPSLEGCKVFLQRPDVPSPFNADAGNAKFPQQTTPE
jgi:hypothetical protein